MTDQVLLARIEALLEEMDAKPDSALGGPAAADARRNAHAVADQLRAMARTGTPMPRHGGKPAPGKLATMITDTTGRRFNRQLFSSNEWCAGLLALYVAWEDEERPTALDAAQAAAEVKENVTSRESQMEAELLQLRVENRQLRYEIAHLRDFMATTGRMP